jgi:hypothetical protein
MNKYMKQIVKLQAILGITLTTVSFSVHSEIVPPAGKIVGPKHCAQIEVSTVRGCHHMTFGVYSVEFTGQPMPLTNRNFVPCMLDAIDSYFPPLAQQVIISNMGEVPIKVGFVCD